MSLELRIVRGTAQGQSRQFDQELVSLGRHPASDFRFDPDKELDVSARHAEIRRVGEAWVLRDAGSTNGTFVNGERIAGDTTLRDGDVISLGVRGPQLSAGVPGTTKRTTVEPSPASVPRTRVSSAVHVGDAAGAPPAAAQPSSARRVAIPAAAAAVIALAGAGAWWANRAPASTPATPATAAPAATQQGAADWQEVNVANAKAIAFVAAEVNGKPFGGTAFGVTPGGLLVTNKHLVDAGGSRATRVAVKFHDTGRWLPAHVVTVAAGDDDLALLQIDGGGTYPVVTGIAGTNGAPVGAAVATLGFPLGTDIPMDGDGDDAIAKASLTTGTVSKRLDGLLQIDGFAAHGASGSPVFDRRGTVVGVIYGGAPGSGGKIVYGVPSERLAALLPAEARGAVR